MQHEINQLRSVFQGEVLTDVSSLAMYATDASLYQMLPQIVVIPTSEEDVRNALHFAVEHNIAISPRGSATSLAGQAVNKGMIIDFTKYLNKIISIDPDNAFAVVQPGVTRDQLNQKVAPNHLHFAPDPATSSRATFGGMIANNSSGTKSILYGKTSDHVVELKIMLMDGSIMILQDKTQSEIDQVIDSNTNDGLIYKEIRELIFSNAEEIANRFPKVMRRVGGYALDAFVSKEVWNLSHLIIGSEGTLAIILEAKIRLTPLPKFQNMAIVHYDDRIKAIQSVKHMVSYGPAAIEMLDHNVISLSKHNHTTKKYYEKCIQGDPQAIMTVEFYGQTKEEIDEKGRLLNLFLKSCPGVYAAPITSDRNIIDAALALRKDGLGIIMGSPTKRKPIPFIEDSAIPLEHLAEYIIGVQNICSELGVDTVLYAHASVGVLHVRPILDLMEQNDISLMKEISSKTFDLVMKYGGSWSGEHGDGRVRSYKMREYYGDQIYTAFQKIKSIFDPKKLLNPNIIVEAEPIDQNLRYGSNYHDQKTEFQYNYRKQHSFEALVHNCSGVGACRNHFSGTMCPSFRATGMEADSTRGRANILRMAMSNQLQISDLSDSIVKEVMDLCLSCKACKSECPSNVDMAKLKSEVLQLHKDKMGSKLSERMVYLNHKIAKIFAGPIAPAINSISQTAFFKFLFDKFANIHKDRNLPKYAKQSLASWYENQTVYRSDNKVALFADTYINYFETHLGKEAISLLNKCGYEVILADVGCCQRPAISNGFLKHAKKEGSQTAEKLRTFLENEIDILVLEPSCHSALVDDLPDLIDDENLAKKMAKYILPIEDFLIRELENNNIRGKFVIKECQPIVVHGHCHQKSSYGTASTHSLIKNAGAGSNELDSGCCGMAGAFGYEKNHFDISKTIFENSFGKYLFKENEVLISNGYSCRHQIHDFGKKEAKHIISLLEFFPSV